MTIEADRQVLGAVVGNLLQNAFKFSRPRTTVTLRVVASAERVLIEIEDECGGLPSGNVNELFRPFEQRGTNRTGVGLGLAFSRWGVEANNGRIYARNLPDKGCVFTVDLPRVPVRAVAVVVSLEAARMSEIRFRQVFLLLLVAVITIAFVAMIRDFLLTILLAAIFTALSYPMYRWLLRRFRDRSALAAIATLFILLVLVIGPLLAVLGAGANEALRVSENVRPRLERLVERPGEFNRWLRLVPGYHYIEPYRAQIFIKAGELLGSMSAFFFAALSATTRATAVFIFHFVILLYTMFFFLTGGPGLLSGVLAYLPLTDADKQRMLDKFVSVTRATLKGTVLIGAAQGLLGGLAFWVVGIDGAIFWGTVMTVLSIIPGIGGALIWVPAAILLHHNGRDLAWNRAGRILRARHWERRQSAAAAAGRSRHADARADDLFFHAWGSAAVRRDGFHPGPHPGGALRDGVGDVWLGVPQLARRAHADYPRSGFRP